MRIIAAMLGLLVASTVARAEVLDINIGSESARFALSGDLRKLFAVDSGRYDVGFLTRQADGAGRDLYQVHAGALVTGDAGARRANVHAGIGARLLFADVDPATGMALALGGEFEARLPAYNRLGLIGHVWGAPSVIAFGDLDRYTELALALDWQLIRQASVYIGWRNVKYAFDVPGMDDTRSYDTGFHGGIRLNF